MTTQQKVTRETPLRDTAMRFHEQGIQVVDWHEGTKETACQIRFHGDERDGFKAVKIAREIGLMALYVKRVWCLDYGLEEYPYWELDFLYPFSDPSLNAPQ